MASGAQHDVWTEIGCGVEKSTDLNITSLDRSVRPLAPPQGTECQVYLQPTSLPDYHRL